LNLGALGALVLRTRRRSSPLDNFGGRERGGLGIGLVLLNFEFVFFSLVFFGFKVYVRFLSLLSLSLLTFYLIFGL
jgi:hypothetical protein